jgi:hypothetical protein
MTSFTGYINDAVIKFPIYFTSQRHIFRQIMDILHSWLDTTQCQLFYTSVKFLKYQYIFTCKL